MDIFVKFKSLNEKKCEMKKRKGYIKLNILYINFIS